MSRIARTLSCLLVTLALVLTGSGGARATDGATPYVICGSEGASTVWLDASGTPVDPEEHHAKCLQCLTSFAVLPEPAVMLLALILPQVSAGPVRPAPPLHGPIAHLRPDSRGPPALPPGDRRHGDRQNNTRLPHQNSDMIDLYQSYLRPSVIDPRATM